MLSYGSIASALDLRSRARLFPRFCLESGWPRIAYRHWQIRAVTDAHPRSMHLLSPRRMEFEVVWLVHKRPVVSCGLPVSPKKERMLTFNV